MPMLLPLIDEDRSVSDHWRACDRELRNSTSGILASEYTLVNDNNPHGDDCDEGNNNDDNDDADDDHNSLDELRGLKLIYGKTR